MTAVYSRVPYPCDPARPRSSDCDTDVWLRLPWPMAQLPGSRWRNLYTGTLVSVTRIGPTRYSTQPAPLIRMVAPLTQAGDADRFYLREEFGLWRDRRYLVEHYTRIDLLTPAEQWPWFELEASHIRTAAQAALNEMRELAAHPELHSCAAINYRIQKNDLARCREEMMAVRHSADLFLRRHNLSWASTLTFVVPRVAAPPAGALHTPQARRKERLVHQTAARPGTIMSLSGCVLPPTAIATERKPMPKLSTAKHAPAPPNRPTPPGSRVKFEA